MQFNKIDFEGSVKDYRRISFTVMIIQRFTFCIYCLIVFKPALTALQVH